MIWRKLRAGWPILHIALWSALFAVFVFLSAPIAGRAVYENKFGPIEANHSTDAYLESLDGLRNGSQRLADIFQSLPEKKALMIVTHGGDSPSEFLGMLVAYLTWPREVRIIKVSNTTVEKEIAAIDPSSIAGIVFCSVKPPVWLQTQVSLGSRLLLVPVPTPESKP